MSPRLLWASVLIGSAASIAAAWTIAAQSIVIGSREGGWVYGYLGTFNIHILEPFFIASVFVAAGAAVTWRMLQLPASNRDWLVIVAWCLLAVLVQGLVRSVNPFSISAMFESDNANSFYSVALKYDVRAMLGAFERLRPTWALHAQSNLPGKLLLVRALTYLSTRPDVLGWVVIVLSNLGGVLMYVFVRDIFGDRLIAALSVILYLVTPAKLFFFPLLNTITPVVVLACACVLMQWLHTGKTVYAAILGAGVYGLILFEPTALVAGILFAALLFQALYGGRLTRAAAIRQIAVGIAAFAATYAIVRVWFGFDLVSAFRHVSADAATFNVTAGRPYAIWVRQNFVDFLFGVGLCQAVLFAAAFVDGAAALRQPGNSRIVILCAALLAMVVVADVAGVNRGEVTRLWIFMACLWQIPAAYVCRRLGSPTAFTLVVITTLLQNTLGSAMLAFIEP